MRYKYLLIDCQNLWWRAFLVAVRDYIDVENRVIFPGVINKALQMIHNLINKYAYKKDKQVYLIFDNPETVLNIRKVIDSEYKSTRLKKSVPKGLYESLSLFIHLLRYYSDDFFIAKIDSLEADDLTKPIIDTLKMDKFNKALVVSNDLDWARNISDNVDWYDYYNIYNINAFKDKFGFSPKGKSIQLYKAIHGDKSDNIENAVPYLPKDILVDIAEKYDDVNDLFNCLWKEGCDYPEQWKLKLKECENDIRKNYTLVDFVELDKDICEYVYKCERKIKPLKILFDTIGLSYENDMKKDTSFFKKGRITKEVDIRRNNCQQTFPE